MKQFLLFAGDTYYAKGGSFDIVCSSFSLNYLLQNKKTNDCSDSHMKWFQIVDPVSFGIIICSEEQASDKDMDHLYEFKGIDGVMYMIDLEYDY